MRGLEALQSVQYVTVGEKRLAVIDMDDWEALLNWLETVEDTEVVREALDQLKAAGGDRARAGWLHWERIAQES